MSCRNGSAELGIEGLRFYGVVQKVTSRLLPFLVRRQGWARAGTCALVHFFGAQVPTFLDAQVGALFSNFHAYIVK